MKIGPISVENPTKPVECPKPAAFETTIRTSWFGPRTTTSRGAKQTPTMSIRPEGREEDPPSKHGIRPRDDGEDDDVEVVLIESDGDGEETPTGTAREDVEVIDVDTDSGGEDGGVAATGGSADQGGGTWRHHAPVVGNLQRLPKGNASNLHSARDKLTRALKRQVWIMPSSYAQFVFYTN